MILQNQCPSIIYYGWGEVSVSKTLLLFTH